MEGFPRFVIGKEGSGVKKNGGNLVAASVIAACICMGLVDAVIQPGYVVKSIIKGILFICIPVLYAFLKRDRGICQVIIPNKKGFRLAMIAGAAVYAVVIAAYFIFRNVFDFSALTTSLTETTGVNRQNFLWVALYISFFNSLLEEYFFRGFAFLEFRKLTGRKMAYCFSAAMFALYHIAMMIGWFDIGVFAIVLVGLFAGGIIFNLLNSKSGSIYPSWLTHMFANFAINTIGFMLFGIL